MTAGADIDLLSPGAVADPQGALARLREEDPVHWSPHHRAWILTRFDDVAAALRDVAFYSSDRVTSVFEDKLSPAEREERLPTFRILGGWMVFHDPPDHTRLRDLVKKAFTVRAVEQLRPRVRELVDELLAAPLARGSCDLVREVAYPLPATIVAEMLGVPASDRDLFKSWSDDITTLVFGGPDARERRVRAQAGLVELAAYLGDLVSHYRASPADNLITGLVQAQEAGQALSDDEVVSTCTLVLFGGHETTTNLIANGFLALLRHPDELRALVADPALAATAVGELNRFDGPSKFVVRRAAADAELRGRTIRAGDAVLLAQCAANRDPRAFDRPDVLDLRRDPNRHLAFGHGIHYCLGAPLARMEAQEALPRLAAALRDARLTAEPAWLPLIVSRGLASLPIAFTP
ncbi:MAG: cytochrome P450 [Actinobacteria bacterium]|nr:cytochrome P450 [Actinomycetota bacterium]